MSRPSLACPATIRPKWRRSDPGHNARTFPRRASSGQSPSEDGGQRKRGKEKKNPFREGGLARRARAVPSPGWALRPRRRLPVRPEATGKPRAQSARRRAAEPAQSPRTRAGGRRALLHRGRAQRRRPGAPGFKMRERPATCAPGRVLSARPAAAAGPAAAPSVQGSKKKTYLA